VIGECKEAAGWHLPTFRGRSLAPGKRIERRGEPDLEETHHWTWIMATSGRAAGTRATGRPSKGSSATLILGLYFTRSEPRRERVGRKGTFRAAARNRRLQGWLYGKPVFLPDVLGWPGAVAFVFRFLRRRRMAGDPRGS